MRVAFINRNPDTHPGGDLIVVQETANALRNLGVEVEIVYGDWTAADLKSYDLIHMFHVNFTWSWDNFQKIEEFGRTFVVTPFFYGTDQLGVDFSGIKQIVSAAAAVFPFSRAETDELLRSISGEGFERKCVPIPSGSAPAFHFTDADGDRLGVLTVSARAGDKNAGLVQGICSKLRLPSYVHVMGVPYREMPDYYKEAKVFVNASGSERMSLTIGEALCAGCRVLATCFNRGNEWYPGIVEINPDEVTSLEWAIAHANNDIGWDYSPNQAARLLTWDSAAQKLLSMYQQVLA